MFPPSYNRDIYIKWHENEFEVGSNLLKSLNEFQEKVTDYFFEKDKKTQLSTLLQFINEVLRISEIRRNNITYSIHPDIPTNKTLFKQKYLKQHDSIVNKFWRKNKEILNIKTDNFDMKLKDLIRFSIKVDSLTSAETIAKVLSDKELLIKHSKDCKEYFENELEKIEIDNEMKMSSGYFAYHCYFYFKQSFIVEIQIFSELSNFWRKMSHKIYDKVRLQDSQIYKFNDVNSRMISIGHLLYLAECEHASIEKEMEDKC